MTVILNPEAAAEAVCHDEQMAAQSIRGARDYDECLRALTAIDIDMVKDCFQREWLAERNGQRERNRRLNGIR